MNSDSTRGLGRSLRAVREELSLSGKVLAEKTGISPSYISEIETGKRPFTEAIGARIAEAMGMEFEELTKKLNDRYTPPPRRMLPGFENSPQFTSSSQSSVLREEPHSYTTKTPQASDIESLAVHLIEAMSPDSRADLLRDLTESAISGDHRSSAAARALLLLIQKINPHTP
jgi:transcriptional regulator with XRE-family HTH domain